MHLDIESLRTFVAVLDHGGMTRAGERLHMTQSAVSRKIQRLEDRVGRPLLIRDGHTLRPTRDGRSLLDSARTMIDLHDQTVTQLTMSDLTGKVKLSSNGEVDVAQIASLLGSFRQRYPGAEVEYTLDHTGAMVDRVERGEIDVAIFEVRPEKLRTTDIVLWSDRLTWVTSPSVCFTDPIPLLDFGEHCSYNDFTHKMLNDAGVSFKTVFSATSSNDVRAAVRAGIGVAVMSERYLGDEVVPWSPPVPLDPLPQLTQVVRTVPGECNDAVTALVDTIQREFTRSTV